MFFCTVVAILSSPYIALQSPAHSMELFKVLSPTLAKNPVSKSQPNLPAGVVSRGDQNAACDARQITLDSAISQKGYLRGGTASLGNGLPAGMMVVGGGNSSVHSDRRSNSSSPQLPV